MPSSPRKSFARVPRRARTSAINGSMRSSERRRPAPHGRAGFVSGPRKLNDAGHPEFPAHRRRVAPRGMEDRGEHEPDARLGQTSLDTGGIEVDRDTELLEEVRRPTAGRRRRGCRASRPEPPRPPDDRGERRMLNVPLRSPPVPQMSSDRPGATRGWRTRARYGRARQARRRSPPFVRRAIRKPPTWAGVTSPRLIARITSAAALGRERLRGTRAAGSVRGQRSGSGSAMRQRTLARGASLGWCPEGWSRLWLRRPRVAPAGVVQWPNASFPSSKRGFDSPHPLSRPPIRAMGNQTKTLAVAGVRRFAERPSHWRQCGRARKSALGRGVPLDATLSD